MNPWVLLDEVQVPGDGGAMKLYQRAFEFSISVKNDELMNSRMHGSEDALAELCCKRVAERENPRVLIGGLGMGFTLRAALDHLDSNAEVVVAELVPAVVKWNRTHLAELAGKPLDDARTVVRETDVGLVIKETTDACDAIMLDVDNGPEALPQSGNRWLYHRAGLAAALGVLRSGGLLAVWSAGPDRAFTERLRAVGFEVEPIEVRARGYTRGARHPIRFARRIS